MKSIINHLGQDFPRVRLGIGRPPGQMPVPAYVLQDFSKDDLPLLDDVLAEAIRAIETYLRDGIQLAMSRHNGNLVNEE
jgi:PTH1 family peptidyl-tRNA hydrolase